MSAETIARWSSIPMAREEGDIRGNKRPRDEDANGMSTDDSEDNISIISRSPSPPPQKDEAMDVDQYDGYYGYVREEITVETKIKSTNKGFAMLSKLGWSEGQPLGVTGEGRVDPIPFYVKNDLTGVGKMSQDVEMIETTVSQRRELDSERQRRETRDERAAREEQVARRAALQAEVSETLRAFYCAVCEKQFQTVAQYDEHTNSYAHHHKIRFRDMQAAQRAQQNTQDAINARKEKERKREEKELRKIAKAAGVKMPSKPAGPAALAPVPTTAHTENEPSEGRSVASPTPTADLPARSGWAALGSAASAPAAAIPAAPPASSSQSVFRSGGWSSLEDSAQTPLRTTAPTSSHGFTLVAAQPQQQQPEQQQHASEEGFQPVSTSSGFQPVQPNTGFRPVPSSNDGFKPVQSGPSSDAPKPVEQRSSGFQPVAEQRGGFQPAATLQQPPSSAQLTSNLASAPSLAPTLAPLGDDALPKKRSKKEKAVAQEKSRSGWQAFQRGGKR